MPTIYCKYGSIVEITEYEKDISKRKKGYTGTCFRYTRERLRLYNPRRLDSLKRAKRICLRRVSSAIKEFGSPLFLTLTFAGDASEVEYSSNALRLFQQRLRIKYPEAVSIFVPELSPRGRIHFHGLLFNLPMEWGDKRRSGLTVEYGSERKTRILASLWKEGFVDCRQTDGSPKLAYYLTKYIMKTGSNPIFSQIRLVRVSRGFPKEIVFKGDTAYFLAKAYEQKRMEDRLFEFSNSFLGHIKKKLYFVDY